MFLPSFLYFCGNSAAMRGAEKFEESVWGAKNKGLRINCAGNCARADDFGKTVRLRGPHITGAVIP